MNFPVSDLTSYQELIEQQGLKSQTNIISLDKIIVDIILSEKTGFSRSQQVWCLIRQRIVDGCASVVDIDYLDVRLMPQLNRIIAEKYFGKTLGILKEGAAADIIIMDYKPFTPLSDENIDGHILFGMTGKLCRTTIANGKLLMKDRELIGIDEEAENAHILEAAKKLWGALNHREY